MRVIRHSIFPAILICLSEVGAQSYRAPNLNLRPRTTVIVTNQGKGHALRKHPPVRPFAYFIVPENNNPQQRAFSATTPNPNSWVRAGTDVNRKFGDYYVDPAVWTNNWGRLPADPLWRDPNNPTNWISTRTIRSIIRAPYTPPR
jgi:hypothetical protein